MKFTGGEKNQMAQDLKAALVNKRITVPSSEWIMNDLHKVKKDVTAAGSIRYKADHTKDGHADMFWGAALAVHAVQAGVQHCPVCGGMTRMWFRKNLPPTKCDVCGGSFLAIVVERMDYVTLSHTEGGDCQCLFTEKKTKRAE